MDQMRTDVQLKLADMALRQQPLRWEPLKIAAASTAAGAALLEAVLAVWAPSFKHSAS